MSIIQSLEKVRSKLKVSDKVKGAIPSGNNIDFNKDNITRKKNLFKNSDHVDHKDTNLGREDFNHKSKLVTIAENKEGGPYEKYTDEDRLNIGKCATENGRVTVIRTVSVKFSNLDESTASSMRKKHEKEFNQALREKRTPATTITSKQRGRPRLLGDLDGMVQNNLRVRFIVLLC